MPPEIQYRRAIVDDSTHISGLMLQTQFQFSVEDFSTQGKELLEQLCSPKEIKHYITRGDVYFVAEVEGAIVGVIGIRDNNHLAHNFVRGELHGQGISTKLWELAKGVCLESGNPGEFELRASTFAIPIYERWGFVVESEIEDTGGIMSTPMRLKLYEK